MHSNDKCSAKATHDASSVRLCSTHALPPTPATLCMCSKQPHLAHGRMIQTKRYKRAAASSAANVLLRRKAVARRIRQPMSYAAVQYQGCQRTHMMPHRIVQYPIHSCLHSTLSARRSAIRAIQSPLPTSAASQPDRASRLLQAARGARTCAANASRSNAPQILSTVKPASG